MTRDTCKMPNCDREPGEQDRDDYRTSRFCSVECDVKYDHLKADARHDRMYDDPEDPR